MDDCARSGRTTDDGTRPEPRDPAIASELTRAVGRIDLAAGVAGLAPGYRTILLLHDVEGYEHEEIASMLAYSPGTSKSQLHKARYRRRKVLTRTA